MGKNSFDSEFRPTVLYIGAHVDDIEALMWGHHAKERRVGSTRHFLSMTESDKGGNDEIEAIIKRRRREGNNSAMRLGSIDHYLPFKDLELSFVNFEDIVHTTMQVVRQIKPDKIVSFSPFNLTWKFDHPDHNEAGWAAIALAGYLARFVGAASDVRHFMPDTAALEKRPELLLLTDSHVLLPKNQRLLVPLSKKSREARNEHLKVFESQSIPPKILDIITKRRKGHAEQYQRVR